MTAGRTWVVTVATATTGGTPYQVALRETAQGWEATVTRDAATWRFALARGAEPGCAWSGVVPLSYDWTPADGTPEAGSGRLTLNGLPHALTVETRAAHRLRDVARAHRPAVAVGLVRSPMPGLVLAVHIRPGDIVARGQALLIIEAMKMENEITAPSAGTIGEVLVTTGQAISAGAALCRIDPRETTGA